jgi:prophage antirepressor-like protein
MNELEIFKNEEFGEIRTVMKDGQPMFCLSDVCKALEISNVGNVKQRLSEKGIHTADTLTNGGMQKMIFINEANLYKTIFQSRKESAERFTDWVTTEVLPSIRKTGAYGKPMTTAQKIQLLAQGNDELNERVDKVETMIYTLENDMPLYGCEIEDIQRHVKRRVVDILGGKQSESYHDPSIRNKAFSDIWNQLKREFGCVSTYKSIKRRYIADVHEFIDCYEPPRVLAEQITDANAQLRLCV